ncbi:flagellin [Phaeovulum vinaykumarii]|uniref:Flagellin n=2 Tax=Phaeovulum vinaykumarii TaxID=407234 RepID=A0A1N7MBW0_9RHOB|nr:flagellin [Phaeovulum vinaykumarii]SIS83553.1 flagellin [Phaeovulum vinaykumarii]SOC10146.1 flagellin [Phaeovulum vinaykumarii]
MSSILTNSGAMVALQTLKGINSNLSKTQNDISTGKSVATAKDNAAVWAISKVMESDVTGFEAISSSLSLGESTVAVASSASETVTDLLNKMKEKIVSAQEANVDRDTIQKDITALTDQISAVVGAAQFNGLNLLDNTESTSAYTTAGIVDGSSQIDVLSSLDRSSSGVAASNITVEKQDLGTQTAKAGSGAALAAAAFTAAGTATANGAAAATYTVVGETTTSGRTKAIMAGDGFSFDMTKFDAAVTGTPFASLTDATKKAALYVAKDGDTAADVAKGLADVINFRLAEQELSDSFSVTVSGAAISVKSLGSGAMAAAAAGDVTTSTFGTVGGGMSLLKEIDVTSDGGAAAALGAIEGLIATSTEASAAFGSVAGRIETQKNFVDSLTDSLKNGISSLVDADMEEASARLQALQTQQQLGIQALSIANQAPQNILSLFR